MARLPKFAGLFLIITTTLLSVGCCEDRSEEISALENKVEELKTNLSVAVSALGEVKNNLDDLEQHIERLSSDVDTLESSVGDFRAGLDWSIVVPDVEDYSSQVSTERNSVESSADQLRTSVVSLETILQR